jgi:hypothetical protein
LAAAEPDIFSLGYVHSSNATGFDMQQTTVAATDFPAHVRKLENDSIVIDQLIGER